jgi:hypothetical protein
VHKKITKKLTIPKVLFDVSDGVANMRPDDVLDVYDLVFKREPYKDRSKYDLSQENQAKIRATMLSCPFVFHPARSVFRPLKRLLEPRPISNEEYNEQDYDVFFSGMISPKNKVRETVWQALIDDPDIKTLGGLQDRTLNLSKKVKYSKLKGENLSRRKYIEGIKRSKIGLGLDGLGQFTFRHLELWYMGAFMICSPNIKEQELPLPVEEGKHYVTYNDVDDLVEKVRYYSKHNEERLKIAMNGRNMFEEFYDIKKNGEYIRLEVGLKI